MNDLPDVIAQIILEYRDEMELCERRIGEYKDAIARKMEIPMGEWTRNGKPMSTYDIKRLDFYFEFRHYIRKFVDITYGRTSQTGLFYEQIHDECVTFFEGLDDNLWLVEYGGHVYYHMDVIDDFLNNRFYL